MLLQSLGVMGAAVKSPLAVTLVMERTELRLL
jgi:hypothetical protein